MGLNALFISFQQHLQSDPTARWRRAKDNHPVWAVSYLKSVFFVWGELISTGALLKYHQGKQTLRWLPIRFPLDVHYHFIHEKTIRIFERSGSGGKLFLKLLKQIRHGAGVVLMRGSQATVVSSPSAQQSWMKLSEMLLYMLHVMQCLLGAWTCFIVI